jgi:hypothetical protein
MFALHLPHRHLPHRHLLLEQAPRESAQQQPLRPRPLRRWVQLEKRLGDCGLRADRWPFLQFVNVSMLWIIISLAA